MARDSVLVLVGGLGLGVAIVCILAIYQVFRDWPSRQDFREARRLSEELKDTGFGDWYVSAWDMRDARRIQRIWLHTMKGRR